MTEDDIQDSWFDPAASTFGDRVTGAREAAGMSQKDLAKRLGVKLSSLQGWEDDLSEPRANKLQMLAGILNVSLTWLLEGIGDGIDGPVDAEPLGDDIKDILAELRALKARANKTANRLGALEKKLTAVAEAPVPEGEPHKARLKRMHMRSMRRGTKEMDLILMRFAAARLDAMDPAGLDAYDALLAENDQDLYQWVTGQVSPPPAHAPLIDDIRRVIEG